MFWIAAAGALGGALAVVLLRNPFYSVLALVAHLVALAVLFLLAGAQFVAAAQVVVYAGAVMVLYLFVVAYIGGADEPVAAGGGMVAHIGPLFAAAVGVELVIAVVGSGLDALGSRGPGVGPGFGSPGAFGEWMLERFLVGFEAASFLLLVAAVGAVVLARRRRGLPEAAEPTTTIGGPAVEMEPDAPAAAGVPGGTGTGGPLRPGAAGGKGGAA